MSNVRERIEKLISEHPVVLFMKGTPQFPQCGFSGPGDPDPRLSRRAGPWRQRARRRGNPRQGVKEFANWPTIPQLYVKGEFVGGCDITREMFQSGELAALLTDAGVPLKSEAGA